MSPRSKKKSHGHVTAQKRGIRDDDVELPRVRLQDSLLSPSFILTKLFRKDGPSLGTQFDPLPSNAFPRGRARNKKSRRTEKQRVIKETKASKSCDHICNDNQRASKRRKVCRPAFELDNQDSIRKSFPTSQHGTGKGLMTDSSKKSFPTSQHGTGKGLMTDSSKKSFPTSQHGTGKGLMTDSSKKSFPTSQHGTGKGLMTDSSKKSFPTSQHGTGKGLMTNSSKKSFPTRQHGMGKGLMTVWRVVNPDAGDVPTGVNINHRKHNIVRQKPLSIRKPQKKQPAARRSAKVNKAKDKPKPSTSRRKVEGANIEKQKKQPRTEKCELVSIGERCEEDVELFALLVDDEELELQELQSGQNPLSCCAHFATNGLHGCSLCKGFLDKFPPNSIMMRPPLYEQPWISSPELVKKLFKVFHFLCTFAEMLNICSFTLDEFALAFQDKDSMLLGEVHVALLKFLLIDIETEFARGFVPRASQNGKFLELFHWVENQQSVVKLWLKCLNPLSWTEILRQVYIAAGFGSRSNTQRKERVSKEVNCMVKYGLQSGTLKGELFSILSEQGCSGKKVADLAKFPKIADLNLAATSDEVEHLISSTLSSDISLFEKISCSSFRLRINYVAKESEIIESDSDDCGSIDDNDKDSDTSMNSDDSDCVLVTSSINKRKKKSDKNGSIMMTVHTEIDESCTGESWLLGLMDGEYSDLSIEEKLTAFVALVDLLGAGTISRMEDPITPTVDYVHNIHHTTGGKIKRSSAREQNPHPMFSGFGGKTQLCKSSGKNQPIDSAAAKLCPVAKTNQRKNTKETKDQGEVHPMQSFFLGSDRRYNRYWLFLGPCNGSDPGHKRIYFESSEDGRWEIIDTEEALCSLVSALDYRGAREAQLLASVKKRELYLCQAMSNRVNVSEYGQFTYSGQSEQNTSREDSSSAVSEVDNLIFSTEIEKDFQASSTKVSVPEPGKREQLKQKWNRLQAFDMWIWNSFYSDLNSVKYGKRAYHDSLARCECCHDLYWRDEKHCKSCHTTFELDFDLEEKYFVHVATCRNNGKTGGTFPEHKVLSSNIQALKAGAHAIESVMPEGALNEAWTKYGHTLWVKRLRRTSTLMEFLQVLGDFVAAIDEERLYQSNPGLDYNAVSEGVIASFTTMPQTISAVALWLTKMDAAISPFLKKVSVES